MAVYLLHQQIRAELEEFPAGGGKVSLVLVRAYLLPGHHLSKAQHGRLLLEPTKLCRIRAIPLSDRPIPRKVPADLNGCTDQARRRAGFRPVAQAEVGLAACPRPSCEYSPQAIVRQPPLC